MSWLRDTWTGLALTAAVLMAAIAALLVLGLEVAGVPVWDQILIDLGLSS